MGALLGTEIATIVAAAGWVIRANAVTSTLWHAGEVIGFMGNNHIDPELTTEVFVFEPLLSIYGDVPLHAQSHGESFLSLAANRFGAEGIYLLDEPEAALSVTGTLALLSIVTRAASAGAQFIIATHSPVVLAAPAAQIYELDEDGVTTPDYDELQAVRQMRGFLDAPDRYLRQLANDADDS